MKKTLALVLTVVMVLSLLCVGASAAEGTAITDAAGFAAMAADGKYYLDADIAIDATYTTCFTGTLDGNGHTVTISVALFSELSGTVKNLTIEGAIVSDAASGNMGAVACKVPKDGVAVLENITNNADVTHGYRTGGLIGAVDANEKGTASVTMTNCVNNGDITGNNMVGGLLGYAQRNFLTMTNCKNTGDVSIAAEKTGLAGGLVGRFGMDKAFDEANSVATLTECVNEGNVTGTSYVGGIMGNAKGTLVTFDRCTNSGNVTTDKDTAAGILGTGGASDMLARCFFTRCTNSGTCTNNGMSNSGTAAAAGMCGYIYGSGANGVGHFKYCVNTGKMVGLLQDTSVEVQHMFVSQMMGYTNNVQTSIEDCAGNGELDGKYKVICGLSSADPANYIVSNLTVAEGAEYFSYATADSNAAHIVTLADWMSAHPGAITISSTIPEYPAEDPTEAPTDAPTEAPTAAPTEAPTAAPTEAPTDAPTEAPTAAPETKPAEEKKGCKSSVACGLVILAVLGTAYVSKKH